MPAAFAALTDHARDLLVRLGTGGVKRIYNISIPHLALLLLLRGKPFVAVEESPRRALDLYDDLRFFAECLALTEGHVAAYFPPPDSPESIGTRARTLLQIAEGNLPGLICCREALQTGFSALTAADNVLVITRGLALGRDAARETLLRLGYKPVSLVVERGEFSQRGWLLDIYPSTEPYPVRIEFFGDEIELIRSFDIETQRSVGEVAEVRVFPCEEEDRATALLSEIEYACPREVFWAARMEESPESIKGLTVVSHLPVAGDGIDSGEESLRGLGILPEERGSLDESVESFACPGSVTMMVLASAAQAERLREIMLDRDIVAPIIARERASSYEGRLFMTTGRLSSGFRVPGFVILTDREVFGERPSHRAIKRSRVSRLLLTIDDLKPGDFVVHQDHGIGRFLGLERQKTETYEEDIITIEYSRGDRVYLPVQGISRLQKYSAGEGHVPALDRLGGKGWQRTKQRVRQKVVEMAGRLLRLYAERKASRGYTFSEDTVLHREFDDFFPYEETPDQLRAVQKIRELMHGDKPMDLLLCGDVGYGKTEVAMRAAFRAVFDGKQAAVLTPTTLLAEQHYRTFRTRFTGFPVTVDYLSRFKSRDQAKRTVAALARGEVDIVIGTHMLLNRDVRFHDLGLLVIDEEHRFGVGQKERLKELRKDVDVLTLTATPIPRTLHLSLSGIRELAVIETPPEERLAVRSLVTTFNDTVIREAIGRELGREGQVFFVHNRVADIEKVADYVGKLAETAKVTVAHGQMPEAQLERIMRDFVDRRVDVLVCTSIIGSGLDIPTANTIIVDRADHFGLSDLYQLRGRVGRGNVQAFAYFLIPGEDILTEEARKRIQAIQEMSYLGAGFRLAMKDLEIRGTGNLLGTEQSGHIYKVGFEMYMDMLEEAVAELKGEEVVEEMDPVVQIRLPAFIPDDYISDPTLRLSFYRRLASVRSLGSLTELNEEITDRFGALPGQLVALLGIMKLRLLAKKLWVTKVTETPVGCRCYFLADKEKRYGMPEDFFDRVIKVLFTMSPGPAKAGKGAIRFYPDGFELLTSGMHTPEGLERVCETLQHLLDRSGLPSGTESPGSAVQP